MPRRAPSQNHAADRLTKSRYSTLHCPAASYPRSLTAVLPTEDAKHLSRIYFDRVKRRGNSAAGSLRYYALLHFLGHAAEVEFKSTMNILQKIQARISLEFGSNHVMINDFFSYRTDDNRMFPDLHQDYDFWVTSRCTGFNLWLLLDHRALNTSFDVWDIQHNQDMYQKLYSRHDLRRVSKNARNRTGGAVAHLEASAFRELKERGAVGGIPATKVNIPLAPGDALVLRQPEVHRTDRQRLQPGQWRLALGFKVLERAPIEQWRPEFGPVSQDLTQMQVRCPGLLPPIALGRPWPDVYGPELLPAYRASGAPTWIGWIGLTFSRLVGGAGVLTLVYMVPVVFCCLLLAIARQQDQHRMNQKS